MFLGALFQTVKGGYDAITIRKKIRDCKKELDEDLLAGLEPYRRFAATERLLIAEYMIELSKLRTRGGGLTKLLELRERVNQQMKKAIADARAELEARTATKLDVARLVSNLRELSLAIDRDLTGFRKELLSEQKKMLTGLESLEKQVSEQAGRIERQSEQALSLEKKAQAFSDNLEGLAKEFKALVSKVTRRNSLIWVFNILVTVLILFLIWR